MGMSVADRQRQYRKRHLEITGAKRPNRQPQRLACSELRTRGGPARDRRGIQACGRRIVKQASHVLTLDGNARAAAVNVDAIEQAFRRKGFGKFGMAEKAATILALIDAWGKSRSAVPKLIRGKSSALFDVIKLHFDKRA